MKEIDLHSVKYPGMVALVDDEAYDMVSKFRWYPDNQRGTFYARRHTRKGECGQMSRLVCPVTDGKFVDHINRNTLDNRRENLRECTKAENCRNAAKYQGANRFKGVYFNKESGRHMARIMLAGKRVFLGLFESDVDAAKAYDVAAVKLHGAFARPNFGGA